MLSRIGPTQEPQSSDDITVTLGDVKELGRTVLAIGDLDAAQVLQQLLNRP